ncbi:hypothetical protein AB0I28_27085 [Phytomonospora sp. NPDC050363]|uniref:hypothetical protein n=1 Tax=Phytomonospora sp. NPDC050363 TaxID=3155642 RepID=UPI0033CAACFA
MSRNRTTVRGRLAGLRRLARGRALGTPRPVATAVSLVLIAAAYYLAARVGLGLELVGGQVTPLWPPTGVAVGCLLRFGVSR